MKHLLFFTLFLPLILFSQNDPRDPFMGYYQCAGYSVDVNSGRKDTIMDTVMVFLKHPEDTAKIYAKRNSEHVVRKYTLHFLPEDSSFDEWPSTPKHYEHGHFYGADSLYHYFFTSTPFGNTRYYLWGKWFKPLSTSIEELNFRVHTFPNPTKDRVQFSGVTASRYVLYSLSGKQLKAGQVETQEVSLHELPQGVYLLQLQVGEETVVKRIIKE